MSARLPLLRLVEPNHGRRARLETRMVLTPRMAPKAPASPQDRRWDGALTAATFWFLGVLCGMVAVGAVK